MLYAGTDPESCITEHTLVYEDKAQEWLQLPILWRAPRVRINSARKWWTRVPRS
jgi:hypothetical protein